jgi:hypothetical protein
MESSNVQGLLRKVRVFSWSTLKSKRKHVNVWVESFLISIIYLTTGDI